MLTPNLKPYDKDHGQTGIIPSPSYFGTATNTVVVNGRIYLVRFVPSRPMALARITYGLGIAATANDAVDVGIYDSALATKLASSGSTLAKLNGALGPTTVDFTAPLSISPGTVYYAAFVAAVGGTGASVVMSSSGSFNAQALFGTSAPQADALFLTSGGGPPLPANVTPTSQVGAFPIMALRE